MAEETLPDQIAQSLRRAILRGDLAPGRTIKERDTAAAMGVSRTPMREAIRILAKDGLVQLRPSRSPVVAQLSAGDVADTIEMLTVLELTSAQLACDRATEAEIRQIRRLQDRMETEFDALDPIDVFELDMAFHVAIAKASHNARIAEAHGANLARLWRVRYLSSVKRRSRERVLTEHRRIAEGLAARDRAQVTGALTSHLDHLSRNVRATCCAELDDAADGARPGGRDAEAFAD